MQPNATPSIFAVPREAYESDTEKEAFDRLDREKVIGTTGEEDRIDERDGDFLQSLRDRAAIRDDSEHSRERRFRCAPNQGLSS